MYCISGMFPTEFLYLYLIFGTLYIEFRKGVHMSEFERILSRILVERNMSQAELSRRSGVNTSSLSRYLSGMDIPASKAKAIADALNVSVDTLLGVQTELNSDERELVALYRAMDSRSQTVLMTTAKALIR